MKRYRSFRKLYGEKDWRVTNARFALKDAEMRSRLSPQEHRELEEADQAIWQAQFDQKGEAGKAIPLATRTLEIRKRLLGSENPETAAACDYLGNLNRMSGKYPKAEALFLQAIDVRKRVLGNNHLDTARSLNNLSMLYVAMRTFEKAEQLNREALEINRRLQGEEHRDTAVLISNLAIVCMWKGDFAKAEPLYQQALAIQTKILGEKHPDTVQTLINLVDLLSRRAQDEVAREDFTSALAARKESLLIQSKLYGDKSWRVTDARLAVEDMEIRSRLSPQQRRELTEAAQVVLQAQALRQKGEAEKAIPLAARALQIRKRLLGNEHPETASSYAWLGTLSLLIGKYQEAEPPFRQALESERKSSGKTIRLPPRASRIWHTCTA